jgi:RNA polymerase sigma-70 factor, ECF subfamily
VSVDSSLQRLSEPSAAEQRAWVERCMKAFENADVDGLKQLLTEDVVMEMPPMLAAYRRVEDAYELHTLQVFTVTAQGISRNSVFQDPEIFATFGLPARLDAAGYGG